MGNEKSQETIDAVSDERRFFNGLLYEIGAAVGDDLSPLTAGNMMPRKACDFIISRISLLRVVVPTTGVRKRTTVLARISKCERDIASLRELIGE